MIVEDPQVMKVVAKKLVAEIAELGVPLGYAICKELYELLPTTCDTLPIVPSGYLLLSVQTMNMANLLELFLDW